MTTGVCCALVASLMASRVVTYFQGGKRRHSLYASDDCFITFLLLPYGLWLKEACLYQVVHSLMPTHSVRQWAACFISIESI